MKQETGFTLYELMIAMAISSFVLLSIHAAYRSQQQTYEAQARVSTMQQNLRGSLSLIQKDIRMAGYDPVGSGNFGIIDVSLDAKGNGTLTFTLDDNLNQSVDGTDGNSQLDIKETFVYALYDYPTASPDGILDLGRKYGSRRQLISKNIEALGLAYAFDSAGDGDNSLDRDANGNVIWAIDSDNDNALDVNLDTDNDGDIDILDNPLGEPLSHDDNGRLSHVMLSDIRVVRIWLLAACHREDPEYFNSKTYRVSNQNITPRDGLHRQLLTGAVRCRNMGVRPNN